MSDNMSVLEEGECCSPLDDGLGPSGPPTPSSIVSTASDSSVELLKIVRVEKPVIATRDVALQMLLVTLDIKRDVYAQDVSQPSSDPKKDGKEDGKRHASRAAKVFALERVKHILACGDCDSGDELEKRFANSIILKNGKKQDQSKNESSKSPGGILSPIEVEKRVWPKLFKIDLPNHERSARPALPKEMLHDRSEPKRIPLMQQEDVPHGDPRF